LIDDDFPAAATPLPTFSFAITRHYLLPFFIFPPLIFGADRLFHAAFASSFQIVSLLSSFD